MATPLQDSLVAAWESGPRTDLPGWFRDRQRRALESAIASPWPTRAAEAWRYTSLHSLAQLPLAHGAHLAPAHAESTGTGLSFVDGMLAEVSQAGLPAGLKLGSLSEALASDAETLRFVVAREPEEGDVFDRLNAAFASHGVWLRADRDVTDTRWFEVRARSSDRMAGHAWHLAHRIDIGEGARIRVAFDLDADPSATGLSTVTSRIRVQRGAELDLAWIARPAAGLAAISRTHIDVERGATLRMHVVDAGSAPSRHDLRIALRGEDAISHLGGVFLLDGRRHADVQLDLRHEAPRASSRTTWRAIANDRSRAVFNGHITVAAGADGTDAQLGCKSLLGSTQAEIDARPVLEIYADDVKCAHGATVGQLDEQALFYLRTRGLDESAARNLLTRAFAAEAITGTGASPALATLEAWLGQGTE
jgi:Fe-S cluster assembly protein SufD